MRHSSELLQVIQLTKWQETTYRRIVKIGQAICPDIKPCKMDECGFSRKFCFALIILVFTA
jgi:hypothetical protein